MSIKAMDMATFSSSSSSLLCSSSLARPLLSYSSRKAMSEKLKTSVVECLLALQSGRRPSLVTELCIRQEEKHPCSFTMTADLMRLRRSPAGFCRSRKIGGKELLVLGGNSSEQMDVPTSCCLDAVLVAAFNFPVFLSLTDSAHAESLHQQEVHQIYGDLGSGLELGVQVLYLAFLLSLVGVASFFVVKQLLIRRELESAARDLQDRVRTGEALPVEYFELGAVMLRKKFYLLASKYLQQAIDKWDGDPQDLAQVHNALGYSLFCDNRIDKGILEYEKAVKLQPGYVVAWNNLGSAYEKKKNLPKALKAYEQALLFDPNNSVAREYRDALKKRVDRLAGVPIKYD